MGSDFAKIAWTGIAFAAMALVAGVRPALGIEPTVEKITQEADGTATYHFKIKIDETIRVEGQGKEPNPDFFTIFNFTGMVPGSEKQPPGCAPARNEYVGPEAADDDEWVSELFNSLVTRWLQVKGKSEVDYFQSF